MQFRLANQTDLPAIIAMLADDVLGANRECLRLEDEQAYRAAFAAIESDTNNFLLVASEGETLVAVCQVTCIPGLTHRAATRGQIEGVRVASDLRGHGVGGKLIQHAIEFCREQGCRIVQLTSDLRRQEAIEFYQRHGFDHSHAGLKLHLDVAPEDPSESN